MGEIVNKVAQSALINLDISDYRMKGERVLIDLKDILWQGIALREKDFRLFIKENDWSLYQDKYVAIDCSVEAIIPNWAFMLLGSALEGIAREVVIGSLEDLESMLFEKAIDGINLDELKGQKVILKGCSDDLVPRSAYMQITQKLKPVVQSLMFGEPCSTVPVYKKPKNQ